MKTEEVIQRLRALKDKYVAENIGNAPALLPAWLAEFGGYASILYEHYAEYIDKFAELKAKVVEEENNRRTKLNKDVDKASDKISMAEVETRIDIRLGRLKGTRDKLEQEVKGATLHINLCQSLMKAWDSEAKGLR